MPNYNENTFLSEPFTLPNDSLMSNFYIAPSDLRKKKTFNRKDRCIEAYQDGNGIYLLPEECTQKGMTIVAKRVITVIGQRRTDYLFAPGKDPKEEDLKPLISLRKK